MNRRVAVVASLILLLPLRGCAKPPGAGSAAVPVESVAVAAAPIPAEVLAYWKGLVGTWIADNSAYQSQSEPLEAFGLEWSWAVGQTSLVGRLYGIQGGREVATDWQFHLYWHPGDRHLVVIQFGGDGVTGVGVSRLEVKGRSEIVQTFYYPAAGAVRRLDHRGHLAGDTVLDRSFLVSEDGTWTAQRTYTWIRQ